MTSRLFSLAAVLAGTLLVGACGDPVRVDARSGTFTDTLTAYALTGTPASFPTALNSYARQVLRIDGDFAFDVAFDIQPDGKAVIFPVGAIGGSYAVNRRVGVQLSSSTFEALVRAPGGTYEYEDALIVTPPAVIALEMTNPAICQFEFSQVMYAKVSVDSVKTGTRQLFLRQLIDPNCGFRSLAPGVPRN
jgi:hypothetical protein